MDERSCASEELNGRMRHLLVTTKLLLSMSVQWQHASAVSNLSCDHTVT